jgi:hypothetical protein
LTFGLGIIILQGVSRRKSLAGVKEMVAFDPRLLLVAFDLRLLSLAYSIALYVIRQI